MRCTNSRYCNGSIKKKIWTCKIFTKHFMDRLTDIRIQVHWIHEIDIWILLTQIFHCSYHTNKAIAKILTTMTCNEHKLFIMIQSRNIVTSLKKDTFLFLSKSCIILKFLNNHMKSVNYSVARNIYFALNFLIDEIFFGKRRRRKVVRRNPTGYLAIHFLWPRAVYIVGAKSCFYVSYRNLCVK